MPGERSGMLWDDSGWSVKPCWARQISLDAVATVCRRSLGLSETDALDVSFHAEGAFNKLYLVQSKEQKMLMRVSLPVDPGHKTRGEVATLSWVRKNTTIPVPRVFAFSDAAADEIGFEWILMELMPGRSAYYKWRGFTLDQKVALTTAVAKFQAELLSRTFSGIRTLSPQPKGGENHVNQDADKCEDSEAPSSGKDTSVEGLNGGLEQGKKNSVAPSQIVDMFFFEGDHFDYDIPRGPFRSSHDWLSAILAVAAAEHAANAASADDDEDKQEAEQGLQTTRRLQDLLPKIFPSILNPPERTAIFHFDLSLMNILVDDQANITAVIDWECISALPLWAARRLPQFLAGSQREEEPNRDIYADADHEEDDDEPLDNQGKNSLYWIHQMEYEQTQLCKIYDSKMRELQPSWDVEIEESRLKLDYLEATARCSDGLVSEVDKWINEVGRGEFPRLGRP